jgi:glucose/arabinose dehydrogenase
MTSAKSQEAETYKTERVTIDVALLTEGLDHPWGIAVLPDRRLLVTEKSGTLRIITPDGKKGEPISGVPKVDARDQGGLLDVALHPGFETNRLVYFSFSEPGDNGTNSTAVAHGRLSDDGAALTDVKVIFSQKPKLPSTMHFGSRLVFDRDGKLYITLGERSRDEFRDQAQELTSHLGKVIRVNDDGSVPADNPFVKTTDALPEIWSYGHRNVQGAALNPATGKVWTIEHGPKGGDEINIPRAGKNYGWPVISFGVNYDDTPVGNGQSAQAGMEQPIYQWTPVIAPGGAIFYQGRMFPEWTGNLLVSGLKVTSLVRLTLDGESVTGEERMITGLGQRIRDVEQDADGAVYVLTDEDNGAVLKITRANLVE